MKMCIKAIQRLQSFSLSIFLLFIQNVTLSVFFLLVNNKKIFNRYYSLLTIIGDYTLIFKCWKVSQRARMTDVAVIL